MEIPKKLKSSEVEEKWSQDWVNHKRYKYAKPESRDDAYVIDTPPPTVSGGLHIGHVYSYSQTDFMARYMRMKGKSVYYPMGWDDNGLPTERRIQNLYGVKCGPVNYEPDLKLEKLSEKKAKSKTSEKEINRQNFVELCETQTAEDEQKYFELWARLGLSIDWDEQYATIDETARKTSQASFLDLVAKEQIYQAKMPIMWDTEFQTSVAQADIEDREVNGHFHDITFTTDTDESFTISTTRPELLAACIAVVAHPDDDRYKHLFGRHAITPLFKAKVPIIAADYADPEKGTGILMVCTFGDANDVEFWKSQKAPLKEIISPEGKMLHVEFGEGVFETLDPKLAQENYNQIAGLFTKQAKRKMVELLKDVGALVGEPRPTVQNVKFYEKGQFPIEFLSTRQWYIKILEHKEELLVQGKKVEWHPENTFKKYENWVAGLNQDWCISRQRYFGVPFPVWYPIDSHGEINYDQPIFGSSDQLPIDPQNQCPPGMTESDRGKANGFIGESAVMDTWATSSMTPQIKSGWAWDNSRHQFLFPADLRPQAHEIIRTWAFYTITKAYYHQREIPWKNIAISGWVVAENKEKISKSKGNMKTGPVELIEEYSADAIRYWAGRSKLGQDTAMSETMFSIGRKLVIKLFNSSKFVLNQVQNANLGELSATDVTETIDQSWLTKVNQVIEKASSNFESYQFHNALIEAENLFWDFCDNYIELVKTRSYQMSDQAMGKSAVATLDLSLKTFLKLFAPFLPFITEEIHSWIANESIHLTSWPSRFNEVNGDAAPYDLSCRVLARIRELKAQNQKSIKAEVTDFTLFINADEEKHLAAIKDDLTRAGHIACDWKVEITNNDDHEVNVNASF